MSLSSRNRSKECDPSVAARCEIHGRFDVNRGLWKSRWTAIFLMGLTVGGSSCSSASKYVQNVFQKTPAVAETEKSEEKVQHAYTSGKSNKPQIETLAQTEKAAASAAESSTPPERKEMVQEERANPAASTDVQSLVANGEDPFASEGSLIQQTSSSKFAFDDEVQNAIKEAAGIEESPSSVSPPSEQIKVASVADPLAAASLSAGDVVSSCPPTMPCPPTMSCPPTMPCPPGTVGAARPFPNLAPNKDEFVCDGGDRGVPARHEGTKLSGLDLEDTVAEYKDDTGRARVTPSSQACIYAPRFGSVSSATLPEEGLQVEKAAGHQDQTRAGGMLARTVVDEQRQADEARSMLTRSRPSAVEKADWEDHLHKAVKSESHVKLVGPREDFRFLQEGQFDSVNSAVIVRGVTAAQEWADGRRPVIIAKDTAGQIVQGRFTAQDYTGVEDRRTPGELRLIKVADKSNAHPGDIVTFTIRFDNVGERELTSLRVVDNLSPRLEYVENSIQSDREGTVNVEDNGFGGKLLTFEFDEPLKGKTGGFVSFQCRVR